MTTPTKPQRKSLESTAKQLHSLTQNMALKSAINSLSSNAAAASNLAAFVENATKTAARANNHNLSPVGGGFITPPNSERSNSGDGNVNFTEDEESSMNGSSRSHSESGDGVNDLCRQKFACDLCRKTFTRKYSLSRHYKEVHQGESRTNTMRPGMQGNSLLAIANDPRFVNDYGLPTMAHRHTPHEDVKIEEFDDDESPPSMVPMTRRALDY